MIEGALKVVKAYDLWVGVNRPLGSSLPKACAGYPSPAGSREEGGGAAWEAAQLRVEDPAAHRGTQETQGPGHQFWPGDSSCPIPVQ